ncbi:hypothetical protein C7S18_13070 [Ahniella affigens]|uniref:Uncharacterized protein n=1 Tax=Ahniella affigens TaxID=2021234 RepID=A0A2P1PT98_9GAMM|nr:hypothetical protein [Ahniella affigens]AVP98073.1 hypothetical protein C7S18_13070 [Ahniella affigens]
MSNGTEALRDMDQRIDGARAEASQLATQLDQLLQQQQQARARESSDTEQLARLRLDLLKSGDAGTALDAADQRVLTLLEKRHEHFVALEPRIAESEQQQTALKTTRVERARQRDEALAAQQACYVETAERAKKLPRWQSLSVDLQALQHQAQAAEQKSQVVVADREQKRQPYEADKLFVYLWQRRYGFPEYDAAPLIRTLDGWVARLCKYDGAHRNYRMLLALAEQMAAHVAGLKQRAASLQVELKALEDQALAEAGFAAYQEAVASAETALKHAEQELSDAEQAYQSLLGQRAAFAAGTDSFTVEALQTLTAQMGREDLQTLRQDARATTTPKDDALVAGLANARAAVSKTEQDIATLRARQTVVLQQLSDAEELRRRFRTSSYDSRDSEFGNGIVVGAVIGELLRGAIVLNDAWDQVHRNHRFRVPRDNQGGFGGIPDFGGGNDSSGGFSTDSSFGGDSGGFSTDDSF